MSPTFGTSGKWCARTEQGNGSISEKAIGFHPSPFHAALAASMPLQSERNLITISCPSQPRRRGGRASTGIVLQFSGDIQMLRGNLPARQSSCSRYFSPAFRPHGPRTLQHLEKHSLSKDNTGHHSNALYIHPAVFFFVLLPPLQPVLFLLTQRHAEPPVSWASPPGRHRRCDLSSYTFPTGGIAPVRHRPA